MNKFPTKAVILARGLGARMRATAPCVLLTPEQELIASSGVKALIPVAGGKTLLELTLENISSAGFHEFVLVIGPEHSVIREFCASNDLDVSFAIQDKPLGTADAVLAAAQCVSDEELFLVVNSDNLYPVESLRRLREANRPAMLAFEREALIGRSNIPEDRVARFATVEADDRGLLKRIVEKPQSVAAGSCVSMNAWLFSSRIFAACRAIGPSERGEYEITAAVQYAIDELNAEFAFLKTVEGVLDVSSRSDIESAGRFLRSEINT